MNSAMGGVCLSTGNFRIRSLPMLHRKLKGVPLGRALPQFNQVVAAQLIAVLPVMPRIKSKVAIPLG
jgi:hypothetical protein